jgi:hypothetical protein
LHEVDAPHPASPNPACVSIPGPRGYHGLTTTTTEGDEMYIGGGILTVILIVLLLIWLF